MIYLIRGNHANAFELQNYVGIKDLTVLTSHHPLTPITLPSIALWSPTDLPSFPLRRQLLNRLIGGEQWLVGLSNLIVKERHNELIHHVTLHTAETYTPYTHQAVMLRRQGLIDHLICTCWETIPHSNEKISRLRHWKQQAYQYVDTFHTPTARAKEALIAEGVDPAKIIVIPYGVDLTRFKPIQYTKNKRPLVLTIARLEKEKGLEDLEVVAKALPQYDFKVLGRGSYIPKGSNITVTSSDYKKIHQEYQKADLFYLPSHTTSTWEEQYGMALVEAMASALPIITTRSGAIPEVVGDAGILVPEKNVDKMVKNIRNILSNPDLSKQYSKLALARAHRLYDAKSVSSKLRQLY